MDSIPFQSAATGVPRHVFAHKTVVQRRFHGIVFVICLQETAVSSHTRSLPHTIYDIDYSPTVFLFQPKVALTTKNYRIHSLHRSLLPLRTSWIDAISFFQLFATSKSHPPLVKIGGWSAFYFTCCYSPLYFLRVAIPPLIWRSALFSSRTDLTSR